MRRIDLPLRDAITRELRVRIVSRIPCDGLPTGRLETRDRGAQWFSGGVPGEYLRCTAAAAVTRARRDENPAAAP